MIAELGEEVKLSPETAAAAAEASPSGSTPATPEPVKPKYEMSEKEALDNAAMFMEARELLQSVGLAVYADGDFMKYPDYKMSDFAKKELTEAWRPLIAQSGIKVSPWTKVLMKEAIHAVPVAMLAKKTREARLALEKAEAENARLRAKLEAQAKVAGVRVEVPVGSARYNNKNAWLIDEEGFFKYDPDGKSTSYLAKEKRKLKPTLPADLEMLCQYNGREFVYKVFNLPLEVDEKPSV